MRLTDASIDPTIDPRLAIDDIAIERARIERARVEDARFEARADLKYPVLNPERTGVESVGSATVGIDDAVISGLDEALLAYVKPDARAFALLHDAPHKRLTRLAAELHALGDAGEMAGRIIQAHADSLETIARNRAALVKG